MQEDSVQGDLRQDAIAPVFPAAFQGKTLAVKTAAADSQLLVTAEWSLK
jgi:hypothetical protein